MTRFGGNISRTATFVGMERSALHRKLKSLGLHGGEEIMAMALREAREIFEREYLLAQLTRFGGNISRTATFVGMERSALHRKLKSLGLHGSAGEERAGVEPAG